MTIEEFIEKQNLLTTRIEKIRKQKENLSKKFNNQLKKQWKKLMGSKDINDVWSEREPKIVDIERK